MQYCPELALEISLLSPKVELYTWFERANSLVEIRWQSTEKTIVRWVDDEVNEAVKDGFLDPKNWKKSALAYALTEGLIESKLNKPTKKQRHFAKLLMNGSVVYKAA